MKKLIVLAVVLVLALVVAPWGVGRLAEKRLDRGLEQLVEAAPYLKVVERKWTGGWFKSEQVVTFEAFGAWIEAMNPKAIEAAMRRDSVEAADADVDAAEADVASADAVESAGEPAVIASPDAIPPEEQLATVKANELMRFTVRNEILHGPVLGLSGFGIARVDSHLVMSEETRKKITEIFGEKDPLEVSTRIGFFGGGTTTLKSEGRTIKPDDKAEISWETFKVAIGYSRNADSYDMDGKWPKLEVKSLEDNTHFVMNDMKLVGDGKRVRGDLYDGDFTFAIDKMNFTGNDGDRVEIADLHYIVGVDTKDEFTAMAAKLGSGAVKSKQLSALGLEFTEIHYDFSLRRLHAETLEKMLADMKKAYGAPVVSAMNLENMVFGSMKEQAVGLLRYDPELVLDRIGIATTEGDGYIKGVITIKGATAEDFAQGNMSLIGKIHADLTIDVSEKMIQKFPNGSTGAGAAVDAGYAERKGDRLICKILFKDGQLTVNGKPQAIPGLGGPPPEGMPPQE
jgi:uncharacterized protein YdgA (DUF945 family)